jgi:uncharacterized membrane protein YhaH (DUF805 family)
MTLFQTFFSFKGRINRQKFWLMQLLRLLVLLILFILFGVIMFLIGIFVVSNNPIDESPTIIGFLSVYPIHWIFLIYWVCSGLGISAKRWHDRDKSAWWILVEFIPLIGPIWAFVELGCLKGTEGPNRFGSDPLEYS